MGLVVLCLLIFPKVFRKPNKLLGKTKKNKENQRKQQKPLGTQQKQAFKGFRPTLLYGFGLFLFCVLLCFPEYLFRKPKNNLENQKYKRQPNKTKQTFGKTTENQQTLSGKQKTTKCLKVSDPPLDMGFSFVFFELSEGF